SEADRAWRLPSCSTYGLCRNARAAAHQLQGQVASAGSPRGGDTWWGWKDARVRLYFGHGAPAYPRRLGSDVVAPAYRSAVLFSWVVVHESACGILLKIASRFSYAVESPGS